MNSDRKAFLKNGLDQLPIDFVQKNIKSTGKDGESLCAFDEAEVWKRVLDYRIVKYLNPSLIVETHAGNNIAAELYQFASKNSKIVSCQKWEKDINTLESGSVDYADIDPFGIPYNALDNILPKMSNKSVIAVSNGEMMAVCRNLKSVKLKSNYKGKGSCKWVKEIYLPYLEKTTGYKVQFFYAFPTTVRVILSTNIDLPVELFKCCKKWMWWFEKYAEK